MTDIYSDIENRLQVLRSRIEQDPALAAEWMPLAASLETMIASLKRQQHETAWRLRMLEYSEKVFNFRVEAIESSLIFRFLRSVGRPLIEWKARAEEILRRLPHRQAPGDAQYERWLLQETPIDIHGQGGDVPQLNVQPLFSISLRIQNPERGYLEQAVDSLIRQTYPNWELCVLPAGSNPGWLEPYLADTIARDPRIRISHPDEVPDVCERGDYVAIFHQHDVLSPVALQRVAEVLQAGPADLIYSDEDRLNAQGRHVEPVFKPDWSPELLLSCPYVGNLMVLSREALTRIGGFRDGFENARYYDLVLRLTDHPAKIRHIPSVLYHARTQTERASPQERHAAGRRALEDTIHRRNWTASVEDAAAPGIYHLRWTARQEHLVSLIVCSRSPALLAKSLAAIRKRTAYSRRELIVVHHVSGENDAAMATVIAQYDAKCVRYAGPFHFSRMNNLGVKAASGEILVFLNDDVEPLVDSWLSDLVAQVERPEIGAAGARLLYPSGTIQHSGIAIGIGDGCGHVGRGRNQAAYWQWLDATRNVSAVTGACLAVRKGVFVEVGGFDDRFPINYNDVDLCLRIGRAGYRIVYEASVILRHYECQTRRGGVSLRERQQWYGCWADEVDRGDPFYSPNLTRIREDASLRLGE
ncbi:MAG TPA: glycosyltransferase [Bryobacteraceae bacterium]|nr:glycosyltransferase [Bryobacteraceae bacterium]